VNKPMNDNKEGAHHIYTATDRVGSGRSHV
jgi:hypothetical protein